MEEFAVYGHAIASMGLFAILTMLLSPITALKKTGPGGLPAGGTPANAYEDSTYRWNRAYLNATENIGAFGVATVAAMLVGASPVWVNWLASIFLVSRVLMAFVHVQGIGKELQGARTITYVVGWLCTIILAVLAVIGAF